MDDIALLYKSLELEFGKRTLEATPVPDCITKNLNQKFLIRPYQQKAFQYFLNYWKEKFEGKPTRHQLLFHMATGSGKTLMMAGLILYLYEQGYRNFLFFVNSTNIIDKTRDNFFNSSSIKYLFNSDIRFGDKRVAIKEVENFQSTSEDCIQIAFSTIQGLHSRLLNPRENSITFEDFQDKKIVMISDEAHHINVETKAGLRIEKDGEVTLRGKVSKEEAEELISWESTINTIFKSHSQNVLLEFTATIDFNNSLIANKYAERLIFDYPLKQFRIDKYSKDVRVLQADANLFERALQAVLLSQYRRKIFEKHKQLIKPVLLFKSKTIADSIAFQEVFAKGIESLNVQKIIEIKSQSKDKVIERMFEYFESQQISIENLISEIKEDFSPDKTLSVNSKEESEKKQLAVNTLEAADNEYRVIFAVDKLNEGWDVLNLFDIVRLYDTRDAQNNKAGETTIKEAQLIGRGARYCPFKFDDTENISKRKFDNDIENEMRICEELYYHSTYNPKYIQELNTALISTGIIPEKTIKRNLSLKKEFKDSNFYKSGLFFQNEQEKYTREDVFSIPSSVRDTLYKVSIRTGSNIFSDLFEEQTNKGIERKEKDFSVNEFNKTIIKKALYKLEFYSFSNIKKLFPNVQSVDELITSYEYLGSIKIAISGLENQLNNLTADNTLDVLLQVFGKISIALSSDKFEYRGTGVFKQFQVKDRIVDKVLTFSENESEDKEFGKSINNAQETNIYLDLSNKDWHVYNDCFGTSEEKNFVKYIDKIYQKLSEKYNEVYLVRNERFVKLYNFDDGKPFEPDYILFLTKKTKPKKMYYQIFIEPKGTHLKETDAWKQNFLISLKNKDRVEQLWDDRKYTVWGMPFYNNSEEKIFNDSFSQMILLDA